MFDFGTYSFHILTAYGLSAIVLLALIIAAFRGYKP